MKTGIVITHVAAAALMVVACGSSSEQVDSGSGAVEVGGGDNKSANPSPATPPATPSKPAGAGSVAAQTTACTTNERTVFSCPSRDGKVIAVCASNDLSKTAGYVQLRFGTADKIEVAVPGDDARSSFRDVTRVGRFSPSDSGPWLTVDAGNGTTYGVYDIVTEEGDAQGLGIEVDGTEWYKDPSAFFQCASDAEASPDGPRLDRLGEASGLPDSTSHGLGFTPSSGLGASW